MTVASHAGALPRRHAALEQAGLWSLFGVAGALQFSIAIAQILLAVAVVCWIALIVVDRESVEVPSFMWPLLAYAALTLLSTAFSPDPRTSLMACKQMVLFLLVPLVYRFVRGSSAPTMVTVIVSFAAASAAVGIFEFGVLHYDNLGQRPQGTLGHYMTYSGLLMLVIGAALARILFGERDRLWAALVLPALAVTIPLTFSRSAEVGACAAVALLLLLKDRRLLALLPVFALIFFAVAPARVTNRVESIFNLKDPTNHDRIVMLKEGVHMVKDHPVLGLGPNMVLPFYAQYREPDATNATNPHLHNVPLQIAAERGLITLAAWLWFVVALVVALWKMLRDKDQKLLAAMGLATVVAMLAAGMFEYNFGDSEFLMLFLILVTLPFAAARSKHA
ncbi:MAG TPA: O-antigen ligase family protein [Vicinamibacterales bacterium]|nr:O-antigen ligase family protein [Vicinamibacterales bacterium]